MILDNIKRLCAKNRITIAHLESEVGLRKHSIYNWNDHAPSILAIKAVADYFGVTVDALLVERGDT